jgi:ribosomal protein S18 acetylase RimI-like enzyme
MTFQIRPYRSSDLPDLYKICLLTGDSGKDASSLYKDPELLGHFYAAPYGVLEPETCFILEDDQGACGYVVAARDSFDFERRMNTEWLPALLERYPLPDLKDTSRDAGMIRTLHRGYHPGHEAALYPAHLHIDLLGRAQGQGQGRKLMDVLWAKLRQLEVSGVHLGVNTNNLSAIAFYGKLGFQWLEDYGTWQSYGIKL